jgi:hypothetical protein
MAAPASAAIPAATAWETRPTVGAATNGAGFTIGVGTATSYAADIDSDSSNPAVICATASNFTSSNIFQYIKITAGTGATFGFYQIISTGATTACGGTTGVTLDRSVGGTSLTGLTGSLYPGIEYDQYNNPNSGSCTSCGSTTVNLSETNATVTTTTTITSSSANFTSALLGNLIYLTIGAGSCSSGTVTTQWREVTAVGSTTSITVDQAPSGSPNTCTGVTMNIGGSADIPDTIIGSATAQNHIFVKQTGTWSTAGFTSSLVDSPTSAVGYLKIRGYKTKRNDPITENCANCVDLQPTATGQTSVTLSGLGIVFENVQIDGSGTNTVGTCLSATGTYITVRGVKCNNFTSNGITLGGADDELTDSEVTAGAGTNAVSYAAGSAQILRNHIHANTTTGEITATSTSGPGAIIRYNLLEGNGSNTGITFYSQTDIENNTIDSQSVAVVGFDNSSAKGTTIKNNLITNSGTVAIQPWTSAGWGFQFNEDGNCFYGNTANFTDANDEGSTTASNGIWPLRGTLDQVLGSSPYNSGNFSITTLTNAYQYGTPGALPGITQVGYPSCGAIIPQAVSSGGGGGAFVN